MHDRISLSQPVISPVLVGRDSGFAMLEPLLAAARAGRGATVLVSGEAGIGKSRFVAEIGRRFATMDGAVRAELLVGRCFEPDHALPFGPLIDVLREWLAGQSPADGVARLGPHGTELVRLLPEFAGSFGPSDLTATLDPAEERRRMFRSLLSVFERAARQGPLMLIIEDIHWCDQVSLEFIVLLARRIAALPLVLLLTYRSDEVQPRLQRMLSTLDRERLAAELRLQRLTASELDHMLRAIFEQTYPIRPDFLAEIHARTDGNPFFVEEVVRALIDSGSIFRLDGRWERKDLREIHIPRSVQDAVRRRVERLSPAARELLAPAAVAGQRFDFAVLMALSGHDERELLALIRELVDSQLVVEESAEHFTFRHALTRETIYAELLARERRALHLVIGETIERLHADMPEPYVADLAYHFFAAEAWEKALEHGRTAGERAEALYSPDAAIEHFSRALDAAAHLGTLPPPDLFRRRAHARATLGRFESAQHDYAAALEAARQAGDRREEWQAQLDSAEVWVGRDYERAGGEIERALALAREIGDQQAVARSYLQLGNWQVNLERIGEARLSLEAALSGFESLGDRHGIAVTLDLLGIVADLAGDLTLMCVRLEEALGHYRALDERAGMASVLSTLSCAAGMPVFDAVVTPVAMTSAQAIALSEESLALSRQIGWRANEAYAALNRSAHLYHRGYFRQAREWVDTGLQIAEEIEHQEWLCLAFIVFGGIACELFDPAAAERSLRRAVRAGRESGSSHFVNLAVARLALIQAAAGDLDAAEEALSIVAGLTADDTIGRRSVWLARGRVALARSNADEALAIAERLLASAPQLQDIGDIPHVAHLRGEAQIALSAATDAEQTLRAAIDGAAAREMRPLQWRIHLSLARLYTTLGREHDAAVEFARAWQLVEWLAGQVPDAVGGDTFINHARELFPAMSTPRTDPPVLTTREREVAARIARGLSNREIGDELFVGARTVETHVGHILNKLGFTSRAQIAAWVAEQRGNPPNPPRAR